VSLSKLGSEFFKWLIDLFWEASVRAGTRGQEGVGKEASRLTSFLRVCPRAEGPSVLWHLELTTASFYL
jgi:hypothetical protein